jgi:hypothetical protein
MTAPDYVIAALRALMQQRGRMGYDAPAGQRHVARIVAGYFDKRAGEWLRDASADDYRAAVWAAMGEEGEEQPK